jgi:hypothetical protein
MNVFKVSERYGNIIKISMFIRFLTYPVKFYLSLIKGLSGIEPLTLRLSGVCSDHLSYRPAFKLFDKFKV